MFPERGQSARSAEQHCWSCYGFKSPSVEWLLANKWAWAMGHEDEVLSMWLLGNSSTYNTVEEHILYSYSICCFYVYFLSNSAASGWSGAVLFVCMREEVWLLRSHVLCVCCRQKVKGDYLEFTVSVRLVWGPTRHADVRLAIGCLQPIITQFLQCVSSITVSMFNPWRQLVKAIWANGW